MSNSYDQNTDSNGNNNNNNNSQSISINTNTLTNGHLMNSKQNNHETVTTQQSDNSHSVAKYTGNLSPALLNNQTNTNSFKFSLLSNVKRAFNLKSYKSHDSNKSIKDNSSKDSSSISKDTNSSSHNNNNGNNNSTFTLPHNIPSLYSDTISINSAANGPKTRLRSVTVDTPTSMKFSKTMKENNKYVEQQVGLIACYI